MKTLEDITAPLDDYEYDEIDAFLLEQENDQAVLNMSELDGLITAVVSGPDLIPPSEWLPVVWGGEEMAPGCESPRAFARISELIIRHLNMTVATLMNQPGDFEPFFMENRVKGKTYLVVDDWCIGYMKGVMLREKQWLEDNEDIFEILAPIPLFTTSDGWDLLDQLADRHIEYLQNQVALSARAAHAYWLKRRGEFLPPGGISVH